MEIHNLLEELVAKTVREVCEEAEQRGDARYCTSPECRTDVVCYVLNRIPPRYVSSGRGFAHLTEELFRDQQLQIDLVRLATEGLKRVSAVTRAFYGTPSEDTPAGPCFNFPTIKGRVLDGNTFFPVSNVAVTLQTKEGITPMFDNRWSNPYRISEQTAGMYTFWPASLPADAVGRTQTFDFEIHLDGEGFSPLTHFFSLVVSSEETVMRTMNLQRDHQLPDLYLV